MTAMPAITEVVATVSLGSYRRAVGISSLTLQPPEGGRGGEGVGWVEWVRVREGGWNVGRADAHQTPHDLPHEQNAAALAPQHALTPPAQGAEGV